MVRTLLSKVLIFSHVSLGDVENLVVELSCTGNCAARRILLQGKEDAADVVGSHFPGNGMEELDDG